jgi:fructuronate reductase
MAAPQTRIVGLTVTEKGYCHRPADGSLDVDHSDIRHDLAHPLAPRSAPGYLFAMLATRFAARAAAPVVLCCDNLPHNGRLLAGLCRSYAEAAGRHDLARWIEDTVRFPCTMVDRIVPATTDEDRAAVMRRYGVDDAGLVKAEPFSQWVIEADGHARGDARGHDPIAPLTEVGALLVADVGPFETMKLRLLNGAHSTLAYLGYLAGCETVDAAMRLPGMDGLIRHLHAREIAPTLRVPGDFDLGRYRDDLRRRFANAALRHRTWQIAMDGSQKLPQRLLGTVADRLADGARIETLALAIAAWMRYVGGIDERGEAIDVRDPLAARLAMLSAAAQGDSAATVDALLGVHEVFAPDLAVDPRLREALARQYARLQTHGARAAVAMAVEESQT